MSRSRPPKQDQRDHVIETRRSRWDSLEASAPDLSASIEELTEIAAANAGFTGRMLVVSQSEEDIEGTLHNSFGATGAHSFDFDGRVIDPSELRGTDLITLGKLGVSVLGGQAARAAMDEHLAVTVGLETRRPFILVPETIEWAQIDHRSYLQGFIAAAERISIDFLEDNPEDLSVAQRRSDLTWGLGITGIGANSLSGKGARIAILDTGLDFMHPDFVGRRINAQSFIPGQSPEDGHGHGTHVTGTACGALAPHTGMPRYGIAYEAEILVGKVLSNSGSGPTFGILAGIEWALAEGAQVINMSLGNDVSTPAPHYTQAGQRALQQGAVIIAAAGNKNSLTGQPANSPTIYSVAAVTSSLKKSEFSNHGKVNIAAPGSSIESALPRPRNRGYLSGTSMAAPHVSGIAALYVEQGLRGVNLLDALDKTAQKLSLASSYAGVGLVRVRRP